MRFSTRLRKLRENKGLSQSELSRLLNISNVTISQYEHETRRPDIETLNILANFFGVSLDYLIGNTNVPKPKMKAIRVNVLGSVPAGVPIEAIEDVVDWEEIPEEWGRSGQKYFGLVVKGDSMHPKYFDGDYILVRIQPDCESGEDCVVYVNGYDATLKTVIKNEDGSISLKPINTNYSPRTYKPDADIPITILGVVKEIRRKI